MKEEEREAREREAERIREQKLQSMRIGRAQIREARERCSSQELQDTKAGASASAACAHSSLVWIKKNGKAACALCLKTCVKYSFQCAD